MDCHVILQHVSVAAREAFAKAKATIIYGPRAGSKSRHLAIPDGLPPGPLRELTGVRVTQVSSLRPGLVDEVKGKVSGAAERWREYVEAETGVLARFANGDAAFTAKANHHYLACWPDERLLTSVMAHLCKTANLTTIKLPAHIRLRQRGNLRFAFNYSSKAWKAPNLGAPLLGNGFVPPHGLAIWRMSKQH